MDGLDRDRRRAGFRRLTRLASARRVLREAIVDGCSTGFESTGVESIPLAEATGRVLADAVAARWSVPGQARAAADGYAVRAAETHGASSHSPAALSMVGVEGSTVTDSLDAGTAVEVSAGDVLPDGADAVVPIERSTELPEAGELEVSAAVTTGENVASAGADVDAGTTLYDRGHRLRPSDLGLLHSTGIESVSVAFEPEVAVIPTGDDLVEPGTNPDPGQVVETDGRTVASLADRWGGTVTRHDLVPTEEVVLTSAIEDALDHDVVVTTGATAVGDRDRLPEVVDALGQVRVHGVAVSPGRTACFGTVAGTPVIGLPGPAVACIVAAVQFLRPALSWLVGESVPDHPTISATLDRKIPSEPGIRTFARVSLEPTVDGDAPGGDASIDRRYRAVPTRVGGPGVLSSVALADGWVVVEESLEGIPAGEQVAVELWER
ncbi:molybdopterin molybdotransferase MoeA [Halovivax cerinus]|uniref:Molybdopterin molybdotransferase MoeA n=1 Tax=Halovivax cerinus TaxID=1487865 RepID=A0ABD5NN01_9EURY|nr:molybdopterin molybdotransferase MoeA [Halovivax cerinus]